MKGTILSVHSHFLIYKEERHNFNLQISNIGFSNMHGFLFFYSKDF